jgi:hypothetical protein
LFGEIDPSTMWVKIRSTKAEKPRPAQIEFLYENIDEKIPYVELWKLKEGEEEATFSNEHQNIPIKFFMIFRKSGEFRINITANFSNLDSAFVLHILKIQQVVSSLGEMKLTILDTGDVISLPIPSSNIPMPNLQTLDFVEKLCFIQNTLDKRIIFPEDGYFAKDIEAANELISIIQKGYYQESNKGVSIELLKPGIEKILELGYKDNNQAMYFQYSSSESFLELFSEKIELGPMLQKIKGYWEMPLEKVKIWLEQAKESDALTVKLVNVELFEEFENWQKK